MYNQLPEVRDPNRNAYDPHYHQGQIYGMPQAGAAPDFGPAPAPGAAAPILENNALVNIATPLLTLITQIRHTVDHQNVPKLRAQVIDEIKSFEQKLSKIEYPVRTIIAARYCLCTAIDEAVLSRPWGTQSVWVQESLLSLFHKETWGGERFYMILEDMAKEPRKNIDFLEFAYFLLSLGFEGKFYDKNVAIREEIRNRIFYRIRYSRQKPEKVLSRIWRDEKPLEEKDTRRRKLKKLAVFTVAAIVLIAVIFNFKVHSVAESTLDQLSGIANVSPITSFSQVIERPIIQREMN
jgi:type VI secretion system protein ImpK